MSDVRVYSQLQPDENGLARLLEAQEQLSDPTQGRVLPKSELHMTVIHFGKVEEVYARLKEHTQVERHAFDDALCTMIKCLDESNKDMSFSLTHTGYERFGKNSKTIVAVFKATNQLIDLHHSHLAYVKQFFKACGIQNVESYMRNDPNFVHALTISPHVTLKKGHENHDLPEMRVGTVAFKLMKLVY